MFLKPTNIPLTVKEFDTTRCGVCVACGCHCGYIAYLKEGELIDLYGHPHDPNGIGSLCTKGITLIQEAKNNPLRLDKPLLREGDSFREVSAETVKNLIKGKVAVFLDRLTDLNDYLSARKHAAQTFSDSVHLPFQPSTLRPQEWREQKVILAFECETVFSEVMATRWLIDAFERSAYIVAISSRYGTTSAKAKKRILLKPPSVVRFLKELADRIEGKEVKSRFEETEHLAKLLSTIKESLILIGETLLRSPWKRTVLSSLQRIRKKLKVHYSIVGNVSPLPSKGLEDFLQEFESYDTLILTGNPAMFMDEDKLKALSKRNVIYLGLFPNLTANNSKAVIPAELFPEREFIAFRNGFGLLTYTPQVLSPPPNATSLHELLGEVSQEDLNDTLKELGSSLNSVINLPKIEDVYLEFEEEPVEEEGIYLVCDSTLVDELGHWNAWTHDIERRQFAYINPQTAEKLKVQERINLRGVQLEVRLSSNIAPDVIFVPNSYEESQPFDPGIRVGRLLEKPYFRVERYE